MKTSPKSAANWAHQTVALFPPTQMATEQFLTTLVSLLTEYTESVLAKALDPKGLIAKFQYLPDLKTMKDHLDDIAAAPFVEAARERSLKEQFEDRKKYPLPKQRDLYRGPIEEVRPGDLLPFERIPEYEAFMKSKGTQKVKHWTRTENWVDNGQRPFEVKIKEEKEIAENPFE
jgi:hypothetical protein